MQTIAFRLETGDKNYGEVYLPDEYAQGIPVMIYCYGWGGNRQLTWPGEDVLRDRAVASGFAFVAFDFYARGDTGGDPGLMTYGRWKDNLSDVFAWCAKQPFADKRNIGCYSSSSGSMAALRFGAENHDVAFIVSVGTAIGPGMFAKTLADHAAGLLSGEKHEFLGTPFGIEFFVDGISHAPSYTMEQIQCPVLFLQGGNDNPYRCADAKMGYDLMRRKNLPATYIEIPGGSHGLENVFAEAMNHTFDWLSTVI